jgi:hypothetical protein
MTFFIFFSFLNVVVLARFEFLMTMFLEIQVFWSVMPCSVLCVFKSLIYDTPYLQYKIKIRCNSFQHNSFIDEADFCFFKVYGKTSI